MGAILVLKPASHTLAMKKQCNAVKETEKVVSAIQLRVETFVDQICFKYKDGSKIQYGKDTGTLQKELQLKEGEILRRINFKQDNEHLMEVQFFTDRRASMKYGKGNPKLDWNYAVGTDECPIVDLESLSLIQDVVR